MSSIKTLTCCCCGRQTTGRQWWNRDTGYGICSSCVDIHKTKGEDCESLFGKEGIHYNLTEVASESLL